jgi:hypothetical protein
VGWRVRIIGQTWDGTSRSWIGDEGVVVGMREGLVEVTLIDCEGRPTVAFDADELVVPR